LARLDHPACPKGAVKGSSLSDLGSGLCALAYPLLVLALSHSPVIAGAVGTVASVVAFGVRLPAGALADRLDRRKTMIVSDGVRTVVLAALAVAVALAVSAVMALTLKGLRQAEAAV
jgi:MFS family permease